MRKTVAIIVIALITLIGVSCKKENQILKSNQPVVSQMQLMSGSMTPGQVHNIVLNSFDAKFPIEHMENITRNDHNLMVDNMGLIVDSLFGTTLGDYVRQRGFVTFDELGAFENDVLNMDVALIQIINKDLDFRNVLMFVHNYDNINGDLVDITAKTFSDPSNPVAIAYMSVLAASLDAIHGKNGIFGPATPPLNSLYRSVAEADAAGFKFEYSVAINEGAGMSAAYLRGSMCAAIFSAYQERLLAR